MYLTTNIEDKILFLRIFKAYNEKKRDIGLECDIIARGCADAACLYAVYVVRGEWKEAEEVITKSGICVRGYRSGHGMLKFPNRNGTGLIYTCLLDFLPALNDTDSVERRDALNKLNYESHLIQHSGTLISKAYTRITKKRYIQFEKNEKIESPWAAKRVMSYVKLVYSLTNEIVDFENGMVSVNIINEIKENTFSRKPIPFDEKERIIKELEQRMTLYSFVGTQSDVSTGSSRRRRYGRRRRDSLGAIKNYFDTRVEAMNELMKILNEHDENMTILELKRFIRNEAV